MLKFVLNGVALNYEKDIALNLIYENPFFFNDRIPSSHSLNFELPPTDHNLKQFNFPNRLNGLGGFKEYPGFEVFFATHKILSGVLVVQEFRTRIKCFFRGSVITDNMRQPLFQQEMNLYSFGTNTANTNIYSPNFWGNNYRLLIKSSIQNTQDFACPPMRYPDMWFTSVDNENEIPIAGGNQATLRAYFNFWNPHEEEYVMRGGAQDVHTVCFPFPKLRYIFDVFFGGQLQENPFAEGELERLVATSTFHPNFNLDLVTQRRGFLLDGYSEFGADDNFILLNSFLSRMPANAFVREALKLISASLFPLGNGFLIKRNREVLEGETVIPWDKKVASRITIGKKEGESYEYGYDDPLPTNEEFQGVQVDDIVDLYNYTVPLDGEVEIYVNRTKETWIKRRREKFNVNDPDRFTYELVSTGLGAASESGFNMKSGLIPVEMTIDEYWRENVNNNGLEFGSWYVPVWRGDRLVRPELPQIGIFRGHTDAFTTLSGSPTSPNFYPLLSPYNYDAFGNRLGDLSLAWEGEDGLLENFHKQYKEYIEQEKAFVRADVILSPTDLKKMDLSLKYHLRGMNFFIQRLNVTIRQNKIEPAQVDLVQADL